MTPGTMLSRAQIARLYYIDFRLYFLGELRRSDLTDQFGIAGAAATRDLAMYRDIAGEGVEFDGPSRFYKPAQAFTPAFVHQPARVLTALSEGFGQDAPVASPPFLSASLQAPLLSPAMEILAPVARAIYCRKPLHLMLREATGESEHLVVPFALVQDGVRWKVRAYDRGSRTFREFSLSLVADAAVRVDDTVAAHETYENDDQWMRVVEIELAPHPGLDPATQQQVRLEYAITNGVLNVKARASEIARLLRLWDVDCSPDHRHPGVRSMLWLTQPMALYGVTDVRLAPGYAVPAAA
jgi:predicted DNA-binding transcriptional regulator YafY